MTTIALLAWPIFAVILFALARPLNALIWGVLLPYLFLPERFSIDLPGLPNLTKSSAISFAMVLCLTLFRTKIKAEFPSKDAITGSIAFKTLLLSCLGILVVGTVLTVVTNREPLVVGPIRLPGMRNWDLISLFGQLGIILVPFLIAHAYLKTPQMHRALLKAIVLSALVYSLLMLVEVRFSPQLHNWVYGYHQHSFSQHIRGGYRPKVFLQHGIWVGFFMFMGIIAAGGLWKATQQTKWLFVTLWLLAILVLSRNLGALAITLFCGGVFIFLWQRAQLLAVTAIATTLLIFPALRQADLIPINTIVSAAASVSEERAYSLEYRIRHENALLDRIYEKPLAGWGSWGRERIFDENGRDISVSEGRWIQTIGQRGWIGYIGFFGLLALPLVFLLHTIKRKEVPPETMALALIATGNLIYMVPNSTLTPVSWLVFGALAGFAQYDPTKEQKVTNETSAQSSRVNRYTRFHVRPTRSSNSAS